MLFCLLAMLGFAVQNICLKEFSRRFPNTVYTQAVMILDSILLTTVILACLGGMQPLTAKGYLIAFTFGLFFVLTVIAMTLAMHYGHVGLTVLIQNSSLLVPVVFGACVWKEQLTLMKIIGIVLILLLMVLSSKDDASVYQPHWNRKKWILFAGLSFVGDSILSILQSLMSKENTSANEIVFSFWTSLFSVLVALAIALILRSRKTEQSPQRLIEKRTLPAFILCCLGVGVGTAAGNVLSITSLNYIDSVILFPVRMGGLILIMWLLGIFIYHEKVTRTNIAMLVVGLTGIVLLNL